MNRDKTVLLNPKNRFIAQNLTIRQILTIDTKSYVVLVIGAMWLNDKQILMPDSHRAVLAELEFPDVYYNLKIY